MVFNVGAYRSDALLLTKDGITYQKLPGLAYDALTGQVRAFHQALHTAADPGASAPDRKAAQNKLLEILEWLWDAAAEPVLNSLGHTTAHQESSSLPRVWWAPGGLLGLLPLHAAGYHTDPPGGQGRRTVMDRVVSSYTPTIRALQYARQHTPAPDAEGAALIVAMPTTPGIPGRLPNIPAEVAMLASRLPEPVLLIEPETTGGDPAAASARTPTKANVLAHLPRCPIAHFACHGATDPADPSSSLLLLHDYQSDPLTVASLGPVNLGQAQLAYLSACRTASTGHTQLIDEAIHLTSAFQLAGFPHVIGTFWEIHDAIAVTIADAFYAALRASDGTLDTSRAALALHHAVRTARDGLPATPSLWAAYLHAGA